MADLKIKLKFGGFEFEIEGDKESVIEEFKSIRENGISKLIESIKQISPADETDDNKEVEEEKKEHPKSNSGAKGSQKKGGNKKPIAKIPKQLIDLNLRPSGKTSLKDFYNKYEIKTNFERNVTYVYYLSKELKLKNITIDHIYTAYKETGQKIPDNIYQSLVDTKKHKGWINTTDIEDITLSIQGENYIEHDAPKAQPKK